MVPFAQTVTGTRRAAGTYDATTGAWVAGATSAISIKASVQPAGFCSIMRMPEGLRTKGIVDVWSEDALVAANEATGVEADLLDWQGEQWEVQTVNPWVDGHHAPDLSFYKAIAVRVDR